MPKKVTKTGTPIYDRTVTDVKKGWPTHADVKKPKGKKKTQ